MDLSTKENIEINYWKDAPLESYKEFNKANFLNNIQECRHLEYKINKYFHLIKSKKKVLEIGAGQGWASCYLKKYYLPTAHFTVTDISPYALKSLKYWEEVFAIEIDQSFAAKSYEIPSDDQQFDLIFCYAAAHHFVQYKETLIELKRVLQDKGHVIFLYEPTSSKLFYPLTHYYVNAVKHNTPEDVLIPAQLKEICQNLSLHFEHYYDPYQTIIRSISTGIYFHLLGKFRFLQKYLPCSADLIFAK